MNTFGKRAISRQMTIAAASVLAVLSVSACGSDEAAPDYESSFSAAPSGGGDFTATVSFADPDKLEAVFKDVVSKNDGKDDGGYWVTIVCSTGGEPDAPNGLAHGQFGIGTIGQAQTGLGDGETRFELIDGAKCPA